MTTAILGWMVFAESLPATWWAGAGLLVMGNVIIGRREEGGDKDEDVYQSVAGDEGELGTREESTMVDSESDDEGR
jgi:drug/metabolite transporter (DMT)-like permease